METIQAVLFDLDGTLVDTLGDLADATNEALRRRGFPEYPEEQYRQMVGNGARRLIERALGERCTPELTGQLLADFVRIYDEGCLRRTAPYPGIPEAVTAQTALVIDAHEIRQQLSGQLRRAALPQRPFN